MKDSVGTENHARRPLVLLLAARLNPNARNRDAQVNRLERKVAAGTKFATKQPVSDVRLVEEMVRPTADIPIPMFTGVWPLMSERMAEFFHNEVPGMVVRDAVRAGMAGLEGVRVASVESSWRRKSRAPRSDVTRGFI